MYFLDDLNPQQHRAVEADDGPVLIVAGPGTGKTKTLTARIAYLLASGQATPDAILALTFTNKAAGEMRQRVAALLEGAGQASRAPAVTTFHALGRQLLQQANPLQQPIQFISDVERNELLGELRRSAKLRAISARELSLLVSNIKNALDEQPDDELWALVQAYDQILRQRGFYDFDDLLALSFKHLQTDSSSLEALQRRYRYILVDEFQDTSQLQYALLTQLTGGSASIFVIGDPLQSIYGFRGAGGAMFDVFKQDFPGYQTITLQTNYRSGQRVVSLANAVFAESPHLVAHQQSPGVVQAVQTLNEYSEAAYILQQIEQGIGGSSLQTSGAQYTGNGRFSDYAVVYRTHQAAKNVQRQFAESGIPYQVVGEGSPYEQPVIQAIIACLETLATNNYELLAKQPALKNFTSVQIAAIMQSITRRQAPSQAAQVIADSFNLAADSEPKRRIISQFIGTLVRFDSGNRPLTACLEYLHSMAQSDFYDSTADVVTLLTIHASKGLEFKHIFVIAAEEGILPAIRKSKPTDFEEEIRLFYVALTRAQDKLDVIYTKQRAGQPSELSRFVRSVPPAILPRLTDPDMQKLEKRVQKKRQKAAQTTLF